MKLTLSGSFDGLGGPEPPCVDSTAKKWNPSDPAGPVMVCSPFLLIPLLYQLAFHLLFSHSCMEIC